MSKEKSEKSPFLTIWDQMDARTQSLVMSEFKRLHPGGFTRQELYSFLEEKLTPDSLRSDGKHP